MMDKNEHVGKLVFGYRSGAFYGIFTGNKKKILLFDRLNDNWVTRSVVNIEEQTETEAVVSFGR